MQMGWLASTIVIDVLSVFTIMAGTPLLAKVPLERILYKETQGNMNINTGLIIGSGVSSLRLGSHIHLLFS